jgi:hypothetical protein
MEGSSSMEGSNSSKRVKVVVTVLTGVGRIQMMAGSWAAAAARAATLALTVVMRALQSKMHRVAPLLLTLANRQAQMGRMQQQQQIVLRMQEPGAETRTWQTQHMLTQHPGCDPRPMLLLAVTTCRSRKCVCVERGVLRGMTAGCKD